MALHFRITPARYVENIGNWQKSLRMGFRTVEDGFDVDRYLAGSPFKALTVFRKGDVPPKNNPEQKPRPDSRFVVLISGDHEVGLGPQVGQALALLNQHETELKAVRQVGVDNMLLDLGVQVGDKMQQAEYIPPELIAALGRLGVGLIFSVVQFPRG